MAIFFFFFFLCLILFYYNLKKILCPKKTTSAPKKWPIIGMMPAALQNVSRAHDYITEVLQLQECNGTFIFKGPLFANLDMVFTADPADVHHILSKNFLNYPKGPEFKKIFDILGDGIFNADSQLWEIHRKLTMSLLKSANFQTVLERIIWQKVEDGLIPVLDHFAETKVFVDFQEIFQRFTFDSISKLLLDYDPCSLSIDLPYIPCEKAFNDIVEALLHRHILPESCWKLMEIVGIGKERSLNRARLACDQFIYSCIRINKEKKPKGFPQGPNQTTGHSSVEFDCLTSLMEDYQNKDKKYDSNLFMKDVFLNLILAGRDTTSATLTWLFWLISKNPLVENKIREEIETELKIKKGEKWRVFNIEESSKLVYLHGAINEALRLYPPVALEHKESKESDILPSGLHIDSNTKVVLSFYSLGRMESIWGKDCLEFKPERWISKRGNVKHEPSFKFPAFNAGPRTCIGKDMAYIQMKMAAATIIYNYQIQALEGHSAQPRDSIILQMKHGFPVKISKRN